MIDIAEQFEMTLEGWGFTEIGVVRFCVVLFILY